MTRTEEIQQAADNYIGHPYEIEEDFDVTTARNSFIQGAEWADKTMIEKACNWLEKFYQHKLGYKPYEEVVEDFRKYMEE